MSDSIKKLSNELNKLAKDRDLRDEIIECLEITAEFYRKIPGPHAYGVYATFNEIIEAVRNKT